jgi:hypothetical protein
MKADLPLSEHQRAEEAEDQRELRAALEPAPEVALPVVVITQRARPDSLRERFGLS